MPYRCQSEDTAPAAERLLIEGFRNMPPWRKAEIVTSLTRTAGEMSLAGLRARHPRATPHDLRLRLAALRLGRDTMIRAFGWDPDKGGR
jgi:hypothetical protein